MTTATTTIFQHAHVAARMIVKSAAPRFEITVFGEVTQTFPATRSWKHEQKLAVEAAIARLALDGITVPVAAPVAAPVYDARIAVRLHAVASTFIAQVGYRAARQELTIVFRSGQVFIYNAVTLAEFNRLRRAHSVGKTFHAIIRGTKSGFEVANAA